MTTSFHGSQWGKLENRPWNCLNPSDDWRSDTAWLRHFVYLEFLRLSTGMHCRRIFWLFALSKEVSMRAHMFSERTGISVPLITSWHFTDIGFVLLMRPDVFESVTRVRVGFTTAREWTNIRFLTYNIQKQKLTHYGLAHHYHLGGSTFTFRGVRSEF